MYLIPEYDNKKKLFFCILVSLYKCPEMCGNNNKWRSGENVRPFVCKKKKAQLSSNY